VDIRSSAEVKNAISLRSIFIFIVVYAIFAILTLGLALVVLLIAGLVTNAICNREIESTKSASNSFKKRFPFRYYGHTFGEFEHTFYHTEDLQSRIVSAIDRELKVRTPVRTIEPISLVDVDKDLKAPDSLQFLRADGGSTKRGTTVTLLVRHSNYGRMQSIRWWVLAGGYIDAEKKFNFIVYSPLTILLPARCHVCGDGRRA
jgi:hypothetical protein